LTLIRRSGRDSKFAVHSLAADALARDVNGVPAVMMVGNDVPVVGTMPFESYRRWIARAFERSST